MALLATNGHNFTLQWKDPKYQQISSGFTFFYRNWLRWVFSAIISDCHCWVQRWMSQDTCDHNNFFDNFLLLPLLWRRVYVGLVQRSFVETAEQLNIFRWRSLRCWWLGFKKFLAKLCIETSNFPSLLQLYGSLTSPIFFCCIDDSRRTGCDVTKDALDMPLNRSQRKPMNKMRFPKNRQNCQINRNERYSKQLANKRI